MIERNTSAWIKILVLLTQAERKRLGFNSQISKSKERLQQQKCVEKSHGYFVKRLHAMNSSMNTLKQDLGIDLNRPVVLTSPIVTYTKFDDADIDNKITKSAQTTYDIQKYQQDIEISQIEHDIDFYYNDNNTDTIELSIEDKKATLENLPVTTELNLRKAYNDLKSLENTIESDRLTVEADQINIDIMQKNIEVGKSSNLDLLALQSTLLTDQNTMQKDVIAYMTAAANFQNSLEQ